jgi:hypothetical protein
MTFEEELKAAIDAHRNEGFEKMRAAVDAVFAKHGREIPPPITGDFVALTEAPDAFK